ncbi:hypothetical protein C5167_045573 [Papaver somniferum]|uniref:Uncharacterized protein n=1 Tax=Papaver somniferum TaxID=3469 RepID=A0A4Y7LCR3_PAPSO|nr:hypothetical protein C5167_045573 [Papaver somniferum]
MENKTDETFPGDESNWDNQSFNESNPSDLKDMKKKSPEVEKIPETVTEKHDRLGEDSCNGSSETIAKDSVVQDVKKSSETTILVTETREPAELWESVAESKSGGNGGEEGTKESSDVQSSASLSKRNRRRKITSGSSSGEERETDEVEIGACVVVLFLAVLTKSDRAGIAGSFGDFIMMGRSRGGLSQRSSGRVDPLHNFVSERSPIARQKPPTNGILPWMYNLEWLRDVPPDKAKTITRLNSMINLLALRKHMRTANKSYGASLSNYFRVKCKRNLQISLKNPPEG